MQRHKLTTGSSQRSAAAAQTGIGTSSRSAMSPLVDMWTTVATDALESCTQGADAETIVKKRQNVSGQ